MKIRYYFTSDGTQVNQFVVDYATCGSANVGGNFYPVSSVKTGADTYLEVGFTSSAGTLAAGASTEVQVRFNKSDWTNYDQSNDYSFNSTASSYVDWTSVTAYLSDVKQWGIEP